MLNDKWNDAKIYRLGDICWPPSFCLHKQSLPQLPHFFYLLPKFVDSPTKFMTCFQAPNTKICGTLKQALLPPWPISLIHYKMRMRGGGSRAEKEKRADTANISVFFPFTKNIVLEPCDLSTVQTTVCQKHSTKNSNCSVALFCKGSLDSPKRINSRGMGSFYYQRFILHIDAT